MDHTDGSGGVTVFGEDLGKVTFIRVQIPGETGVTEPHDPVGVRVATGEDGGTRGAAARGNAEAVLEEDALRRQRRRCWGFGQFRHRSSGGIDRDRDSGSGGCWGDQETRVRSFDDVSGAAGVLTMSDGYLPIGRGVMAGMDTAPAGSPTEVGVIEAAGKDTAPAGSPTYAVIIIGSRRHRSDRG